MGGLPTSLGRPPIAQTVPWPMLRALALRAPLQQLPTAATRRAMSAGAVRATFEDLTAGADDEQLAFMKEMIIQVDEADNVIGPVTKKDAHFHAGALHRAFSVFLFNSKNELLIQKRAQEKITFPSYWANTCCSHPNYTPEEIENRVGVKRAAIRKLEHELGIPTTTFQPDELKYVSTVLYKAASDANWIEWEVDHILLVRRDVPLNVNSNEVAEVEFVGKERLHEVLQDETRQLSPWFRLIATRLLPMWWENLDTLLEKDSEDRQIHDYC